VLGVEFLHTSPTSHSVMSQQLFRREETWLAVKYRQEGRLGHVVQRKCIATGYKQSEVVRQLPRVKNSQTCTLQLCTGIEFDFSSRTYILISSYGQFRLRNPPKAPPTSKYTASQPKFSLLLRGSDWLRKRYAVIVPSRLCEVIFIGAIALMIEPVKIASQGVNRHAQSE
jgi:hypothetical protein